MSHVRPAVRQALRPLSLAIAMLLPLAAQAQSTTTDAQDKATTLDTVKVTADRRIENIQDVPVSIGTIGGEKLDALASGGTDVRYLSARVPSLNIESSFGRAFPRFYIRGYGNTDFRLNTSQPVSLVYDDIVQENPILKGFPVFDVEQVEVLRGPQGTLFGRNSPAGVVKFSSVRPSDEFGGYAKVGFGSDAMWNLEGAVGGALGGNWSARVSVLHQRRDDWVKNTYSAGPTRDFEGYEETAVRAQLLYSGDGFEALFGVHARKLDGSSRLFRANIFKPGTNDFVDGFDTDTVSQDGINRAELDSRGFNARLRWDFDGVTLYSITGYEHVDTYSRGDIDGGFGAVFLPSSGPGLIPFASETADGIPKHAQWTQEFRLESDTGGTFDWQAGLFWFNEDYRVDSFSYDSLGGNAEDGFERIRQTNDAWAVFAGGKWQATDRVELRAGVRYTVDEKDLDVEAYYANGFVPCVLLGKCTLAQLAAQEPDGDLSASPGDKKFNWDLSATFAVSEDVNLYARVATGYRGSSIQAAGAFNAKSIAAPETSIAFDAGVKADFWDKRGRLSFGVFRYEVKDLQLTAVGGAANANILLNADKSTGQGFELELEAYVADGLLLTFGSSYNDTEIQDRDLAVSVCAQCTVTDPLTGDGKALIDGNPLPQAPRWSHNATARWGMPVGNGAEFFVFTDWAYRSEVNFFLYESKEFRGKSLLEGGLRLGYGWGNGNYEAALYGRNITNQIRAVAGIDFNNLTGMINEPRTWGVQFTARF